MERFKVGVIGGTGMVGQRFVTLMENHPWFQLTLPLPPAPAPQARLMRKPLVPAGPWTPLCPRKPAALW